MVTGYDNARGSSGEQQKVMLEGPGSLDDSVGQCCPAGPGVLQTFT